MKKRKIEKQLRNELSTATSSDFSVIRERCQSSMADAELVPVTIQGNDESRRPSVLKYVLLAIGALLIAFGIMLTIKLLEPSNTPTPPVPPSEAKSGYFVIDINPSIKISYDENGNITDCEALNEDAKVLLVGMELSGKPTSEAVSTLFEKCIALGYFSSERENNAIMASATTDEGIPDDAKTNEIKKLFSDEFSNKKMRGVVITGIQNTELEKVANEHGIDSQKYALILSYLDMGGELDERDYANVSIGELYDKISDREQQIKKQNTEKAKLEQEEKRDEIFNTLFESIEALISEIETYIDQISDTGNAKSEKQAPNDAPPATQGNRDEGKLFDKLDRLHSSLDKPSNETVKNQYKWLTDSLDEYIKLLKLAEQSNDCEKAVNGIIDILTRLKDTTIDEGLIVLCEQSSVKIQTLYAEFSEKSSELESITASAEQTNSARLEVFKDAKHEEHEDVEKWQQDNEESIASNWYELKKQWNNERKNDLKK